MKIKGMNEIFRVDPEVERVSEEVRDLSIKSKVIKGSYSVGSLRKYEEALKFAQILSKNKKLMKEIKPIYEDVYEYLENINYHTANLALDYLFNRRQFDETLGFAADYIFQYA